jgi:hypothetical protein
MSRHRSTLVGLGDQILFPFGIFLSEICGVVSGGHLLLREHGSAICSVITQWSKSPRTRNHILLSHLRLPQHEGPGSRIGPLGHPVPEVDIFGDLALQVDGGLEYLHRSPVSHKRRCNRNTVPKGVTGPPCSWGIKREEADLPGRGSLG